MVLVALGVAGLALGVLWYLAAPRQGFRIDASGDAVRVGAIESEALIGADGWFVLITAAAGLLAGLAAWRWRSVRGPAVAVGLAAGGVLGALAASWIGHLLGPGPSAAALRHAGGPVLHTPLELRSKAGLVVEPFVAVAAYLVAAGFAHEDDLGRGPRRPAGQAPPPDMPPADFLPR